ncbi:glycosyltransferase family 8 protein [Porphyromonadaceae bacterium OttesenSCG-928-L07]|nr:glycosyltransferase family 8 protein [Porphyromonadaceae bacterium OttesenSCG-928-L07]MDL2251263.1 glycosyltransferase family 8 protein [Odoribacter sp. OttesenSCG-928-J03]
MEKIHITCNIDENYTQHCAVTLVSLFENHHGQDFEIHIIADQLSEQATEILTNLINQYGQSISFYFGHEALLDNCSIIKSASHISIATYYRCFLTSILPPHVKKTIYLDCDLIVRHPITELWNIDIDQYSVACVEDMWSSKPDNYDRLNYPSDYSYFNAGVLLINLEYWRQHNICEESIRYIKENSENLLFNDQDVLNGLLHQSKLFVPTKWNMQDGFFRRKRKIRKTIWKELDESMKDPAVVHYTGSKKPWHYKSEHPYKSEYYKYLDMTIWKGWRPAINYRYLFIKQINNLLYNLGIIQPKYLR